ncbi:TetR family transcriptional regulator [Salmonella enterica subsp. arizonae]|uniref:TetR family transcriptional regulator n=1 Tax=Salmonella enterica subsp. arizonae TaxID=59203 RepID=A0A2X4TK93_SALER|nr:TetR family transcriptional regulator [Salmonella enterica subsp. arizonae]
MMGVRAQQKEKTRRSLVEAAFSQLSAERSFASLSLREVAREAGIAPTSFYRHFRDVDELGLTMVDESGLMLRQLMRQARQRIAKGGSVIRTSVSTFMEFIGNNPNAFRLLLRERSGTSARFVPPSRGRSNILLRNLPIIWNSKTICRARLLKPRLKRWSLLSLARAQRRWTSALNSVGN